MLGAVFPAICSAAPRMPTSLHSATAVEIMKAAATTPKAISSVRPDESSLFRSGRTRSV